MPKSFSIVYSYVADFYYLRIASHFAHIKHFKTLESREGFHIFGGTEFPYNSGHIFLHGFDSNKDVENFIREDPFVKNGLVTNYFIEEIEPLGNKTIEEVAKYYTYLCK